MVNSVFTILGLQLLMDVKYFPLSLMIITKNVLYVPPTIIWITMDMLALNAQKTALTVIMNWVVQLVQMKLF